MDLHSAIETYFEADERGARDLLISAFRPDASVSDEGSTHVGREAIGAWWSATKARYQTVLQPLEASEAPGATIVKARVTGDFAGSPAILSFAFRVKEDRIQVLEIEA